MKISQALSTQLAGSSLGRIALHLICLSRDHHVRWHLKGIRRELRLKTWSLGLAS